MLSSSLYTITKIIVPVAGLGEDINVKEACTNKNFTSSKCFKLLISNVVNWQLIMHRNNTW